MIIITKKKEDAILQSMAEMYCCMAQFAFSEDKEKAAVEFNKALENHLDVLGWVFRGKKPKPVTEKYSDTELKE
jgi:hypothetical protein